MSDEIVEDLFGNIELKNAWFILNPVFWITIVTGSYLFREEEVKK